MPKRYGYTAAHRREDMSPHSTNLTDAEWDLVADFFERSPGQRGTPPTTGGGSWCMLLYSAHGMRLATTANGISTMACSV